MASASAASTPTRSASCGVKRYGSDVRGSGGRNRRDGERRSGYELAKEPHLRHAVGGVAPAQHGAARARRPAPPRSRLSATRRQQRLEERAPGRDLLAEQEVEAEPGEGDRDREDEDASSGACARSRPVVSP